MQDATPAGHTSSFADARSADAEPLAYETLRSVPHETVRAAIRSGRYRGQTAGLSPGKLQANLAILGAGFAEDFLEFCARNAQPCPLVGLSQRGDPAMGMCGDIDIRTDIPSYNVYRAAELTERVCDIRALWQDDFVAFALGCSFTFERALADAGIPLPHIDKNKTVAMYRTSIPLQRVGPFGGTMVVSMRPMPRALADTAADITGDYVHAHGRPVHIGQAADIGIENVMAPDWGDPPDVAPDDTLVFWACGVTPQNALADAKPAVCITHTPGCMLIADVDERVAPDFERAIR